MRIRFEAPVFRADGFGELARGYIAALHGAGHEILVVPSGMDSDGEVPSRFGQRGVLASELAARKFTLPPHASIVNLPTFRVVNRSVPGSLNIGFVVYEAEKLPEGFVDSCNSMSAIFTQSRWNKRIFEDSGVRVPVFVVYPAMDPAKRYQRAEDGGRSARRGARLDDEFIFYAVFEWRRPHKDPSTLLAAYFQEFRPEEPVLLRIKTFERDKAGTIEREIAGLARELGLSRHPPVELIIGSLTAEEMWDLYSLADVFVAPHHGEGWGAPSWEAMANAVVPIATNFGANIEYMTPETAHLVKFEMDARMKWANADVPDLRRLMRRSFENREETREMGRRAQEAVFGHTPAMCAEMMTVPIAELLRPRTSEASIAAIVDNKKKLRVQWLSHGGHGGYADFGRYFVRAISEAGHDVSYSTMVNDCPNDLNSRAANSLRGHALTDIDVNIVNFTPDVFRSYKAQGALNIGFTMYESTRLRAGWDELCNEMDAIFVPSTFCRDIFEESGVTKPIYVVQPGVYLDNISTDNLEIAARRNNSPADDTFRLVSIATWCTNKNQEMLLEAYREEFRNTENVLLTLKTMPCKAEVVVADEVRRISQKFPNGGEIRIIEAHDLSAEEIWRLHAESDCYASPHHGEGWGMPAMHSMALGKPPISTNWGGVTDFITRANGYLLPYTLVPVRINRPELKEDSPNSRWASADKGQLRRWMRHAFEARGQVRVKGARAKRDIEERFTPSNSARSFEASVRHCAAMMRR